MKIERLVMFIVVAATFAFAGCVENPVYDPTAPGDGEASIPSSEPRPAALEEAFPQDGAIVTDELVLFARVDAVQPVEVRFLLDADEVGVVNELPYRVRLNGCELSPGNHLYTIEVVDDEGNRDFREQWFTVQGCE